MPHLNDVTGYMVRDRLSGYGSYGDVKNRCHHDDEKNIQENKNTDYGYTSHMH